MALDFLDEMVDSGLLPSRRSYGLVVDACRRAGMLELADEVGRRLVRDRERVSRVRQGRGMNGGAGRGSSPWAGPPGRVRHGPVFPFQPRG
jgi:hypothetical protein